MADLFVFWLRAFVCVSGARACCVCDRGQCSHLMCVHDWCGRKNAGVNTVVNVGVKIRDE